MTTYFITGGFGFLGQYIVKAIHDHDPEAELRVLVRRQRSTYLRLEMLDRINWIAGELTSPGTFANELTGVDTVIHNAALVSFRRSDADAIYQTNVIGTRNLMQAALEAGCKNFIFMSSVSAIGIYPPNVSDESTTADLESKRRTDMYGYSKIISEKELQGISGRMRVVILNPGVILGPGSDRIETIRRATRYLPFLPMLSYVNSFVDVRDVADAVVLSLVKGWTGERYIVTAHHMDMLSFTQLILQALDKKLWLVPISGRWISLLDGLLWWLDRFRLNPGIRRLSEINIDKNFSHEKISREMGWEPKFTLEQSVTGMITGS